MRAKRISCMIFACMLVVSVIGIPANAAEMESITPGRFSMNLVSPRVTGGFSMTIPAKSKMLADESFLMTRGETVTIKASYAPFEASVDFGLLDSDGVFHYFNVTDGSIDKKIEISKSGRYTLEIRNNSSSEIEVSGFVKY